MRRTSARRSASLSARKALVRRVEARLDGLEDASTFVGSDLRPPLHQGLSGAGQVPLAKPANERCARCDAGGGRPGFLPVLAGGPPRVGRQLGKRPGEPGRPCTAKLYGCGVGVVRPFREGHEPREPLVGQASTGSANEIEDLGRQRWSFLEHKPNVPCRRACELRTRIGFGSGRQGRLIERRCPARPASDRHRGGRGQDRLLGVGAGNEAGHSGGNGRVASGPLGPQQGSRNERGPIRVVDLELERFGIRRHGCEAAVRKGRKRSEPRAIPLGDQKDRMPARNREQAGCDVGGHDRQRGPVGIPHKELVAPHDWHDVGDEHWPCASERVSCQARAVVCDDCGQRGREREGRCFAVGHDRGLDGDA